MFVHLAALVLASAPAPAAGPAAPRYYVILFGGQSIPFKARTAHTWATFVKTTPTADATMAVEQVTISWLPAEGASKILNVMLCVPWSGTPFCSSVP